jgi:hypothetical protein
MRRTISIISLVLAGSVFGALERPTIPAPLQAEIAFTALDAQAKAFEAKQAQDAAVAAVAKATAICGDKYTVVRQGNSVLCGDKPDKADKPETPKTP